MDALVDATVRQIELRESRIVTVAETSHFSRTSHAFHFKLLRRLHEGGSFDCFASERLGALDAVFMNAWLAGDLGDTSLDELYDDVLPFGGLGTRMWMPYFKATQRPFHLLGLAPDDALSKVSDRKAATMKAALRTMKSTLELIATPVFDGIVSLRVEGAARTPRDAEIKRAFALAASATSWSTFRDAWKREVLHAYREHGNLFINGFHLARGGSVNMGHHFPARARPLFIGMGAAVHERQCALIDEAWLARLGITASDFAASNAAARKAWSRFLENPGPKEYNALRARAQGPRHLSRGAARPRAAKGRGQRQNAGVQHVGRGAVPRAAGRSAVRRRRSERGDVRLHRVRAAQSPGCRHPIF